ncbi:MAG: tRNA (adenosine(37)-N6)-threonylcarbamoyltransferase complex dimerization subunit type 1 TsaB [Oscillospiraceae bacterium]|nr:tRNA (adenosine(37)-N6)-threonylcarbamoyltransferase complex dimerization subunit type 1 TsaB [Oscillospiraceae bacterium]
MKILALESSAKAASCAVLEDSQVLASAWQATGLTHSRTLLPMVEDMLKNSELELQDIDAMAVAVGPGSFTGLRIGVSAVKGLAWAAEKPCIPVSTLEAMAWPLAHLEGNIVCAMDARRQQIYNAIFLAEDGELTRLREDRAISLAEAAEDLADMNDGPMYIVGDGAQLCYNYLCLQGVACQLAPVHLRLQSAVGVGLAVFARPGCSMDGQGLYRLDSGGFQTVSAQELAPVYLRLSQAERERLARERGE